MCFSKKNILKIFPEIFPDVFTIPNEFYYKHENQRTKRDTNLPNKNGSSITISEGDGSQITTERWNSFAKPLTQS